MYNTNDNKKYSYKNNNGISLIALSAAIIIMIIISATIVYRNNINVRVRILDNMYNDIKLLEDNVSIYYSKYRQLPTGEEFVNTDMITDKNPNDNEKYYVINLELLGNITLNYGKKLNDNDVYIINEKSHTIYYPNGVAVDEKTYYRAKGEYTYVNIN